MNDRERIFEAVRNAVATRKDRAPLPDPVMEDVVSTSRLGEGGWEAFRRNFEAVNGDFLESGEALRSLLERGKVRLGYCPEDLAPLIEPWLPEGVRILPGFDRSRIEEYGFGVTRAAFAVAETGTLVLHDRQTPDRLGALAPWAHIAVVRKDRLLRTVVEAIGSLPADDPNVIWVTGPSKTADVEGILIEGVHGPGIQACFPV
ncbi:MAG: lactate utilization protein C [Puniceicoccaceae bacterium]